jgi:putative hydrolase of HD superfamily
LNIEINDPKLKQAVEFHGHLCPGLLIGYRAALIGLEKLGGKRAEDEELVAIVENDSCSVDAIQFLTGCTFGKGNLVFRDWGKQVFTLAYRPDGRGVRLVFQGDRHKPVGPDGQTDREAYARWLIDAKDDDVYKVAKVTIDMPRQARIFPTIPCDSCGEGVMEPRLNLIDGKKICYNCLFKMDPETALTQVADFLFEVGMLKKTPRTGYQFLGNGFETVAAHSFRTAVIAFILAKSAPGADPEKALKMALFHDLAEARTGDHNYVNKQYVAVDEERATRDATRNIPNGLEVEALLLEYYAGETLEAQLAYDADQLDMILELKEKKDLGNRYADAWMYYAHKRLKTDVGKALFQAVAQTDWTNWWFHRKEHLWVRAD